jgi:hypothetical protein
MMARSFRAYAEVTVRRHGDHALALARRAKFHAEWLIDRHR